MPHVPQSIQPLVHSLVKYYGEGSRPAGAPIESTAHLTVSLDRFIACCTNLRICHPPVARVAFLQVCRYTSAKVSVSRLWTCLWFVFVRMLSTDPLAKLQTYQWKYNGDAAPGFKPNWHPADRLAARSLD